MLLACTIFNGQQAIIPNYIGIDFAPKDNIHFVNLSVGDGEYYKGSTELIVRCSNVHNDGTNTYITFNDVFTKYSNGFIKVPIFHDQLIGIAHTSYNQEYKTLTEGSGISLDFIDGSVTIGSNTLIDGDLPAKPLNLTGFTIDSSGDTVDVSGGGGGGGSAPLIPIATFFLGVYSNLIVANQASLPRILVASGTFHGWRAFTLDGPVGANAIFDIKKSSNNGSTWTSLWASTLSARPKIVDGSKAGSGTIFDTSSYSAGDILLPNIIQIGSTTAGKNVTLELY